MYNTNKAWHWRKAIRIATPVNKAWLQNKRQSKVRVRDRKARF